MRRLDPHEAAKRLYEMRRKRETACIRQLVTGATMAPPQYRFPLIGVKKGEVGGGNNTGVKE
jgi:hypothetical protein